MPSSATDLGLELQATGENSSTWGDKLNTVITLLGEAIKGRNAFALSGAKTLTNTNYVSNEARCFVQHVTSGTGGTVTIPDVARPFLVINDASGNVVMSASGGTDATVYPGERVLVVCTGTNVFRLALLNMSGAVLANLADPASAQDAATKAYVDAAIVAIVAGDLPGGIAGQFLQTNGAGGVLFAYAVSAGAGLAQVSGATLTVPTADATKVRAGTSTADAMTPGDTYGGLAEVTLTSASNHVAADMATFVNAVHTLTENTTLDNPTNPKVGQAGNIRLVQHASAAKTLAVGSSWKRVGGALALSTTLGGTSILKYEVITSTLILYDLYQNPS